MDGRNPAPPIGTRGNGNHVSRVSQVVRWMDFATIHSTFQHVSLFFWDTPKVPQTQGRFKVTHPDRGAVRSWFYLSV